VAGPAEGVAEAGGLLAGLVLGGLVLAGAVPTGVELAAGELLALPGAVLLADPVALADGDGDGLCDAEAPPTRPPLMVVPSPGLPWTTADSGLPVACSSNVSGTAQPMNAATMNAAGPTQRRCWRPRSCEAAATLATTASSSGCSGRPWARMASARAVATAADRRRPRSVHQEIVPDSRLPTVIPTSVPATPIRLPRTVANRVPAVAAAMAGR